MICPSFIYPSCTIFPTYLFLGGLLTLIDHYLTTERPPTWRRTGGFIAPKTACGTRTNGGFNMQLIYKIMNVSWNRGTPKSLNHPGGWVIERGGVAFLMFADSVLCCVFQWIFCVFCHVCVSCPLVSLFFCAQATKFWHFMPRKLIYFFGGHFTKWQWGHCFGTWKRFLFFFCRAGMSWWHQFGHICAKVLPERDMRKSPCMRATRIVITRQPITQPHPMSYKRC